MEALHPREFLMTGGAESLPQATVVTRLHPAPSSVHNSDSSATRTEGTWKTGQDTEWQGVSLPGRRTGLPARERQFKKRPPVPDVKTVTVASQVHPEASAVGS